MAATQRYDVKDLGLADEAALDRLVTRLRSEA